MAHGIAYTREMKQGNEWFKGCIIGDVAVRPDYRGRGLCKQVIQNLDTVIEAELDLIRPVVQLKPIGVIKG